MASVTAAARPLPYTHQTANSGADAAKSYAAPKSDTPAKTTTKTPARPKSCVTLPCKAAAKAASATSPATNATHAGDTPNFSANVGRGFCSAASHRKASPSPNSSTKGPRSVFNRNHP